jgi:uncharacterized protein (TIGR02996 family)
MPQDDAFLQAILASPDDDTPRLVYADWLDERGAPRGEFIRVQCELARLPDDHPRRKELEARERGLLQEHERGWAGPLRALPFVSEGFSRGFVESVRARPEAFIAHAEALFRALPVRRVTFQPRIFFQVVRPHLVRSSAAPAMPDLAACPHLARLRAVSFWANFMGDSGLEALAASPFLGHLCLLDLRDNDLGNSGLRALADSPNAGRLDTLLLGRNRIGPAGAEALARSRDLTQLTSLDLGGNLVRDAGVVALASSPNAGRLATLDLSGCGFGTAGARALGASPHLGRLHSLDVRDNRIGNKARQALRLRFGKGNVRF